MVNNSVTTLATASSTGITSNDTIALEVTGTGATVTLNRYRNDVLVAALTNVADTNAARITAAGRLAGVIGSDAGTMNVDDWEGGDVTAGGGFQAAWARNSNVVIVGGA
jgi:hypothetical protein